MRHRPDGRPLSRVTEGEAVQRRRKGKQSGKRSRHL